MFFTEKNTELTTEIPAHTTQLVSYFSDLIQDSFCKKKSDLGFFNEDIMVVATYCEGELHLCDSGGRTLLQPKAGFAKLVLGKHCLCFI